MVAGPLPCSPLVVGLQNLSSNVAVSDIVPPLAVRRSPTQRARFRRCRRQYFRGFCDGIARSHTPPGLTRQRCASVDCIVMRPFKMKRYSFRKPIIATPYLMKRYAFRKPFIATSYSMKRYKFCKPVIVDGASSEAGKHCCDDLDSICGASTSCSASVCDDALLVTDNVMDPKVEQFLVDTVYSAWEDLLAESALKQLCLLHACDHEAPVGFGDALSDFQLQCMACPSAVAYCVHLKRRERVVSRIATKWIREDMLVPWVHEAVASLMA